MSGALDTLLGTKVQRQFSADEVVHAMKSYPARSANVTFCS